MEKISLNKLEKMVKNAPGKELLELLKNDERKGAKKLADRLEKKLIKAQEEKKRIEDMYIFHELIAPDKRIIAGADEAGRGPLAGPIVGAAVVLDENERINLADSKTISRRKREEMFKEIKGKALSYGIGVVNVKIIDSINILNANKLAIVKALENMDIEPEYVLIDGNQVPEKYEQKAEAVVKGDKKAASIAAAGIIAKVTRDSIMYRLDKKFPGYGFVDNKGYPTKDHYIALQRYGPTPIHRKSFIKNGRF